jgi:hypothetical protein
MIERVEHFHAELQVVAILRAEIIVLEEREVAICYARIPNVGNRSRSVADREFRRLRITEVLNQWFSV